MFTVKYSSEYHDYISKLWYIFHSEVHNIVTKYHKYKAGNNKHHKYKGIDTCSYSLEKPVFWLPFLYICFNPRTIAMNPLPAAHMIAIAVMSVNAVVELSYISVSITWTIGCS